MWRLGQPWLQWPLDGRGRDPGRQQSSRANSRMTTLDFWKAECNPVREPILLLNLYKYVQHTSVALPTYSPATHLLITLSFWAGMELWASGYPTAQGLHEQAPQTQPHVTAVTANALAVWGEGRGKYIFLSIWVTDLEHYKAGNDRVKQDCKSRFFRAQTMFAAWKHTVALRRAFHYWTGSSISPSMLQFAQRQADYEEIAATSVAATFIPSAFYFINWESKILVITQDCFIRISANNLALTEHTHECFSFWMRHLKITLPVDLITVKIFHHLFQVITVLTSFIQVALCISFPSHF